MVIVRVVGVRIKLPIKPDDVIGTSLKTHVRLYARLPNAMHWLIFCKYVYAQHGHVFMHCIACIYTLVYCASSSSLSSSWSLFLLSSPHRRLSSDGRLLMLRRCRQIERLRPSSSSSSFSLSSSFSISSSSFSSCSSYSIDYM